ncbi:3-deoxy-D-manno-octulosonic acid transferase [Cognatishimia sp. F0-27]|uniref:3-deoxy-D-manno-octulosonic acid transferase n=1 Tax=Cognatishimia sp. F0-27 TaxID=2816855 RepID=UPI001D0C0421|nr:glycosyltransferase N-terminal domain-containing protein [Cognatishimia sp. F0-27]MCC1492141.1 3-deoxy-D-manno-octulosonic acid transferase [Cognatishimia sp. F0-27]
MAVRPLSLTAYAAWARSHAASDQPAPLPPRPPGPLILAVGAEHRRSRGLSSLCARVQQTSPDLVIACTGNIRAEDDWLSVTLPADRPADAERFVSALSPDIALLCGQTVRPALIAALRAHGTHILALDIGDAPLDSPAPRWLPDPVPAALALCDAVHVIDQSAARRLRRAGLPADMIRTSGPLNEAPVPPDCADAALEELSATLSGRPVWLAAHLRASETGDVLRAHSRAVRLSHRLLLIAVPHNSEEATAIDAIIAASGIRCARWDNGELPDDNTQILLTEGPEELGLWYRAAPLGFLGGSLVPGYGGHDPLSAAALGTAILYGPNVGRHLDAYSALVAAGAARIVRDADSLGTAVSHLIAPDQAASMAMAGWTVISDGAALTDRLVTELLDVLDRSRTAAETPRSEPS